MCEACRLDEGDLQVFDACPQVTRRAGGFPEQCLVAVVVPVSLWAQEDDCFGKVFVVFDDPVEIGACYSALAHVLSSFVEL